MPDYLKTCELAARAGGAVLLDWVGKFAVREKGPADLVTEADEASQEAVRQVVLGQFPSHGFVGEESAEQGPASAEYRWIVDPLDGTMNYVHGLSDYAVSVALARGEEIVVGAVFQPVTELCYLAARGEGAYCNGQILRTSGAKNMSEALVAASFAAKINRASVELQQFVAVVLECQGVRRTGSAALNLCHVAAGRFDAFWANSTKSWDVAAGALMVTEAGGVVSDVTGAPFSLAHAHPLAAGTGELHAQLCRLISAAPPL